jgi:hypothetical protein
MVSKQLDCFVQVGILFSEKQDPLRSQANPNGFFEIYVKGIYQGSPADRSGVITEGDTLLEVNGENVRGLSLQIVAPMITGPLNTPVQLGFTPGKEAREAGLEPLKYLMILPPLIGARDQEGMRRRSITRSILSAPRSTLSADWMPPSGMVALGCLRKTAT